MAGSIEQPLAKLRRAAKHYRTIKDEFFDGFDRQTWTGTLERHRDGLEYRVCAGEIEPLPPELPLIFGDAYFNLRAALDYLVYQMHLRHFRGRIPAPVPGQPDVARRSAFPIFDTRPEDGHGNPRPTVKWKEIQHLAKRERAAIEWLQPYQSGGLRLVKEARIALTDISMLNNIDKHRELHLARSIVQAVETPHFLPKLGFRQNPAFGVTLETGIYIDTWTFDERPPSEQMNIKPRYRAAIEIEPGGERIEALAHLGGSILAVQQVIDRFSHLFPPPTEPLDLSWVRMRMARP